MTDVITTAVLEMAEAASDWVAAELTPTLGPALAHLAWDDAPALPTPHIRTNNKDK